MLIAFYSIGCVSNVIASGQVVNRFVTATAMFWLCTNIIIQNVYLQP